MNIIDKCKGEVHEMLLRIADVLTLKMLEQFRIEEEANFESYWVQLREYEE